MSTFNIEDIAVSIDRFATDFVAQMVLDGVSPGLTFYDFDSRNDFANLPNVDLFGPNGFAFDEEMGGMITIATAFISSTVDDRNGYRHLKIMSELHQMLRPGRRMKLYDAATGLVTTEMVITTASLGPTVRSQVRPMQGYAFKMLPAFITA